MLVSVACAERPALLGWSHNLLLPSPCASQQLPCSRSPPTYSRGHFGVSAHGPTVGRRGSPAVQKGQRPGGGGPSLQPRLHSPLLLPCTYPVRCIPCPLQTGLPWCRPLTVTSSSLKRLSPLAFARSSPGQLSRGWDTNSNRLFFHAMTSWMECSSFLSPLQVAQVLLPLPEHVLHLRRPVPEHRGHLRAGCRALRLLPQQAGHRTRPAPWQQLHL